MSNTDQLRELVEDVVPAHLQDKMLALINEAMIDELKNLPFDDRDKLCMDCNATSKVDDRIAELQKQGEQG